MKKMHIAIWMQDRIIAICKLNLLFKHFWINVNLQKWCGKQYSSKSCQGSTTSLEYPYFMYTSMCKISINGWKFFFFIKFLIYILKLQCALHAYMHALMWVHTLTANNHEPMYLLRQVLPHTIKTAHLNKSPLSCKIKSELLLLGLKLSMLKK